MVGPALCRSRESHHADGPEGHGTAADALAARQALAEVALDSELVEHPEILALEQREELRYHFMTQPARPAATSLSAKASSDGACRLSAFSADVPSRRDSYGSGCGVRATLGGSIG